MIHGRIYNMETIKHYNGKFSQTNVDKKNFQSNCTNVKGVLI